MDSEPIIQDSDSEKPKRGLPDEEIAGAPETGHGPATEPERRRRWPYYLLAGCFLVPCLCCVLPICLLAVTGVGFAAALSNSGVSQSHTETVTLSSDAVPTLTVSNPVGAVTIRAGNDNEVVVEYTKKAYGLTKGRATAELDNIQVDVQQPADNQVKITVNTDRQKKTLFTFANRVNMTVTVPAKVYLAITNNVGSIDIQNIDATGLELKNNTGSITFTGSLSPDASSSYSMTANTGAIRITLPRNVYAQIDATADVGSINVSGDFAQRSNVEETRRTVGETWHGTLGTGSGQAPVLRLRTNTGEIDVSAQ
jgi:hypothetical protein